MQAIGYKELVAALDGGLTGGGAAEEIKLRSRQYAKRQLTWFRRNPAVKWLLWEKTPDLSPGTTGCDSIFGRKWITISTLYGACAP